MSGSFVSKKPKPLDVRYDAKIVKPIRFDSGVRLKKGDIVHVDTEYHDVLGIKWTDREGTHVAAIALECAERVA